jgi:HD-GYP domain-containing protein (c-di-GMP phosphodiesterase class II)
MGIDGTDEGGFGVLTGQVSTSEWDIDDSSGAGGALVEVKQALERRYLDLTRHGDRVAHLSGLTAGLLDLEPATIERIRLAGALHDVGKASIDAEILLNPGPPTPEQWDQIRQHPRIGFELLVRAGLDDIAAWVLAHHERVDGLGYPRGLEGDRIPIEAKILAVADAYDAMLTHRVYRAAMAPDEAVAELRDCAGTQFDPTVVDVFITALELEAPAIV